MKEGKSMEKNELGSSRWYYFIDAVRGFALLNMLFFHFYYDVYVIFGQDPDWYYEPIVRIWQQFICMTFLIVSGMSWHFSHNNVKRGILLNVYGMMITAVTYLVMPDQVVWFGILNCIGCCTLLMIPLHKVLCDGGKHSSKKNNLPKVVLGFALTLILFLATRNISDGYWGFVTFHITLPKSFYNIRFMTIWGFPYQGFRSSDYFPLLPWFFLFLTGYWLWELISCSQTAHRALCIKVPLLSRLGQKTVWIYLLHQPLLYSMAYLLIVILKIRM